MSQPFTLDQWVEQFLDWWGHYVNSDGAPRLAQGAAMTDPDLAKALRDARRTPAPEEITDHDLLMSLVNEAVTALPGEPRQAVEMYYRGVQFTAYGQKRWGRYPVNRYAQILGVSPTAFKDRLKVGRNRVAAWLQGAGIDFSKLA